MSAAPLWPLVFGLISLVIGVTMFIAGFRPRRRGDTPCCRRCGYSLIGLESSRCPECGTELTPQNIVRGERIRRPWVFRPGIVLCMAGIFLLSIHFTGAMMHINWDQYRPAQWLVADLTDPTRQARAMAELERRQQAGLLADEIEAQITELALKEQVSASPTPLMQKLLDFAAARIVAGKATAAQKERFFQQAMSVTLDVRPEVNAGDPAPFRVRRVGGRGPSGAWWVHFEYGGATLDGVETNSLRGSSSGGDFGGGGTTGSSTKTREPGRHIIEVKTTTHVRKGPGSSSPLVWSRDKALKAGFTVLPPSAAAAVRLLDRPDLKPQIAAGLSISQCERRSNGEYAIVLDLRNAPVNTAFEVFARINGKEYPIGTMALPANHQMGFHLAADSLKSIETKTLDFILRSSEKVARQTVDLHEIWTGEITLESVEVK